MSFEEERLASIELVDDIIVNGLNEDPSSDQGSCGEDHSDDTDDQCSNTTSTGCSRMQNRW